MRRRLLLASIACALGCARAPAPPPPAPVPPPAAALPEGLLRAAHSAREAGDPATARARLEEAIALDPTWDLPRIELAEVLVAEGADLERAWASLDGIPVTSDNPRFHAVRAQLLELRSDDAGAADAYRAALALRSDPDLRMRRALLLARLGRPAEAVEELERVRAERPRDVPVRAALADAYELAGRRPAAEAELLALAEAEPDRPSGWERLARFYARGGELDKARKAERRAREAGGRGRALRPLLPSSR